MEADNSEVRPLTWSGLTRTCDSIQASLTVNPAHWQDTLMTADRTKLLNLSTLQHSHQKMRISYVKRQNVGRPWLLSVSRVTQQEARL